MCLIHISIEWKELSIYSQITVKICLAIYHFDVNLYLFGKIFTPG